MKGREAELFPLKMAILGKKLKNKNPPAGVNRILKTPKFPSLLTL